MFLAHAPISYLANEAIQKKKISGLKNSQQIVLAFMSLFFGVLPDFDFFLLSILGIPTYTHHDFFTHTPIYWIGVWLILVILSKLIYPLLNIKTKQFLTKDFLNMILNAFLIGGLSHLLADLLVGNIILLYPFSEFHFTILKYIVEPSYFTGYFSSVYFAIELVIIAIFFFSFSKKFLKKQKWDNVVAYILIGLSSIYLIFTIVMNVVSYNNSFLENSNKPYIDYDADFDTLRDIEDWDIDNDGIDNIEEADYEDVIENAQDIIRSNKLAVGEVNNIFDKILMHYGALDSYRLISQAFYEDFSPIEPVIKDFYIKSLDEKSYIVDFDYAEVLMQYFESKNELIALNFQSDPALVPGKIFFLIDENGEVMNMGITLYDNDLGIVLPGEKQIQKHSLDGILKFYGDTISSFQIVQ
ncbi:MAG: metal-dependent hydrolase [Candidatus Dojkabacteria bacterium]|nr:metal-dependent hydrolase [Candidatus Dojkabacteria bacterium]